MKEHVLWFLTSHSKEELLTAVGDAKGIFVRVESTLWEGRKLQGCLQIKTAEDADAGSEFSDMVLNVTGRVTLTECYPHAFAVADRPVTDSMIHGAAPSVIDVACKCQFNIIDNDMYRSGKLTIVA